MHSILVLLIVVYSCAVKADIYTATSENGVEKWSTQAVDSSYRKTSIIEDQHIQSRTSLVALPVSTVQVFSKPKASRAAESALNSTIVEISNKYGVNPELVGAIIAVESNFNTLAISPKGARGLMQLMPATAKRYGMKDEQELHTPAKNIDMGVRHLKDLLNLHNGQITLAIASYNAGQNAVAKKGQRIPNYRETMIYVPAVLVQMARYSETNQKSINN